MKLRPEPMSQARLDDLYARVSDAIRRSEKHQAEGLARDAMAAFLEVSLLEEEIAAILPASDPEGALARQGAVTAALDAGDVTRAMAQARYYLQDDGLSPELRADLDSLRLEAKQKLREIMGAENDVDEFFRRWHGPEHSYVFLIARIREIDRELEHQDVVPLAPSYVAELTQRRAMFQTELEAVEAYIAALRACGPSSCKASSRAPRIAGANTVSYWASTSSRLRRARNGKLWRCGALRKLRTRPCSSASIRSSRWSIQSAACSATGQRPRLTSRTRQLGSTLFSRASTSPVSGA